MTTSDERRRNLLWGPETLTELSQDGSLPTEWRAEAVQLLGVYPPVERLQQCDDEDLRGIEEEFRVVLLEAARLFERVCYWPSTESGLKHRMTVVLRHFR